MQASRFITSARILVLCAVFTSSGLGGVRFAHSDPSSNQGLRGVFNEVSKLPKNPPPPPPPKVVEVVVPEVVKKKTVRTTTKTKKAVVA